MAKRRSGIYYPVAIRDSLGSADARHVRSTWSLPIFAFLVSVSFVLVTIIDPTAAFAAKGEPAELQARAEVETQSLTASGEASHLTASRGQFGVTKFVRPVRSAPAVGKPDPGTAKAIAYEMVMARGWSEGEYACLVSLWNRESHWSVSAGNPTSGAFGIPQALPGSKMASAGADWRTNPRTQITWGLGYIAGRYGTPCKAWASSQARGWY